jgi:hypothetical protein
VSEIVDLASEGSSKSTDGPAPRTSAKGAESGHRSERQFDQVVERLIYVATADNMIPLDTLAALAKALGTLLAFTARREGLLEHEVLKACQNAVADYATSAAIYMRETASVDPAVSEVCS